MIQLVTWSLASPFWEFTPFARTLSEVRWALDFWSVYHDDHT